MAGLIQQKSLDYAYDGNRPSPAFSPPTPRPPPLQTPPSPEGLQEGQHVYREAVAPLASHPPSDLNVTDLQARPSMATDAPTEKVRLLCPRILVRDAPLDFESVPAELRIRIFRIVISDVKRSFKGSNWKRLRLDLDSEYTRAARSPS